MKHTKKSVVLTLALLSLVASCGKTVDPTTTPTPTVPTPTTPADTTPAPTTPAPTTPTPTTPTPKPEETTGDVILGTVENGTLEADKTTDVAFGEEVTFTVTAAAGYRLDKLTVNGTEVTTTSAVSEALVYTYTGTATMVKGGLNATATMKKAEYEVTIEGSSTELSPTGGTVVADKTTASIGDTVTFTITPDAGKKVQSFQINGEAQFVTGNTVSYTIGGELGDYGIFVSVMFGWQFYYIDASDTTNGSITSTDEGWGDDFGYILGDTANITVTADTGYYIDTIILDGVAQEVTANATEQTLTFKFEGDNLKDHTVGATFTDFKLVSDIAAEKTAIQAAENAKIKLTADQTISEALPMATDTTIYDLNGHTITSSFDLLATEGYTYATRTLTLKNGTVATADNYAESAFISNDYIKSLILDGVTVNASGSGVFTALQVSNGNPVIVKNSTINVNGAYGIATNNLEGENGNDVTIENSKITTTTTDYDNTAFLNNVENSKTVIKNSTFIGDRHGAIIRTGTAEISGSTFTTTGKWLAASDSNKTTDAKYVGTAGSWRNGNEVVSAALVLGDERADAYNTAVTATLTNNKFNANGAKSLSIHSDGKYATAATMDALTAMNAYADEDSDGDSTTTVTKNNFLKKTVAELNAMTASDSGNVYYVTGVVTSMPTGDYGNLYLADKETGEEIYVYGSGKDNAYSYSNGAFTYGGKTKDHNPLKTAYVGKEVTLAGTFDIYKNSPQLKNTVLLSESDEKADAKVIVGETTNGTIVLDKESYKIGDKVTITATPNEGYKVSEVKVTTDGEENNLTAESEYSFTAGVTNTITVEFVSSGEKTNKYLTCDFTDTTKYSAGVNQYNQSWQINTTPAWDVVNFSNNNKAWGNIRCGQKKVSAVATLTTKSAVEQEMTEVSVNINKISCDVKYINSITLEVATDAGFETIIQTSEVTKAAGVQKTTISTPTANAYYRYKFNYSASGSNGCIEVSGVTFTYLG